MLTEAGEKWVVESHEAVRVWPVFMREQAEFRLRAFCDEVEKRIKTALDRGVAPEYVLRAEVFKRFKHELLVNSDGK